MKIKLLMVGLLGLVTATTFAQKRELESAESNYKDYQVSSQSKLLAKKSQQSMTDAKASIDKASVNPKTANEPKTFALKAAIYASLAVDDSVQTTSAVSFSTASDALKQAKTLDTKNENKDLIEHATIQLAQYNLNKGVAEFQNKKFEDAYKSFDAARQLVPTDTTSILNSGIAAINMKNYTAAIGAYNNLLTTNYSQKNKIYNDLPGLYLANKDTTGALKSISDALVKYPTNGDLRRQEIIIALQSGKLNDVIGKIEAAIKNDPTNKNLYYYEGLTYSQLGDAADEKYNKAKDEASKAALHKPALDYYAKGAELYKKALAVDPDYFDANLNLGYVLMKPAIDEYNAANQLPASRQKDYEAGIARANAQFDIAKPYLQRAVDLNPKSADALSNLRNYYRGRTDQAHAAEYKAKADDLKKQIDALH